MEGPALQRLVDEADYLAAERDAETRHEYIDGVPFAMSGASRAHNRLATDLTVALGTHLRGGPCRVASSDMKVRLADGRRYYHPDLVVSGGDASEEPDDHTETRPVLIVEILSPSTEATDRREKRLAYQTLPSLVDYLIVVQDSPRVERLTRTPEGWTHASFVAGEDIELVSVDLTLPTDDLYAGAVPDEDRPRARDG